MSSYGTLRSIQSLGIVYSCVARGDVILAFSVCCQGNFSEVVPRVLGMIPNRDERMTYTSGDYMFHYVTQSSITLLCITDDNFERSKAFYFLEETKTKFFDNYGDSISRFTPYSLNSTFGEYLSQTMDVYSNESFFNDGDSVQPIRLETINVKELDQLDESGQLEQLELLQSDDNYSLRSVEGLLEAQSGKIMKVKNFLKHNLRGVFIVIMLIIVMLVVILAIIIIVTLDESEKNNR